jgi:hypothetical protein
MEAEFDCRTDNKAVSLSGLVKLNSENVLIHENFSTLRAVGNLESSILLTIIGIATGKLYIQNITDTTLGLKLFPTFNYDSC